MNTKSSHFPVWFIHSNTNGNILGLSFLGLGFAKGFGFRAQFFDAFACLLVGLGALLTDGEESSADQLVAGLFSLCHLESL